MPNCLVTIHRTHISWDTGWKVRFYADGTVPQTVLNSLEDLGAEVVRMENVDSVLGLSAGMFWRFMVADDPSVDRFIVRDTDSRLNARDRLAIEEWIRSKKSTHSIRDHPGHGYTLSGGLWGSTRGAIQVGLCSGSHSVCLVHYALTSYCMTEYDGHDPGVGNER